MTDENMEVEDVEENQPLGKDEKGCLLTIWMILLTLTLGFLLYSHINLSHRVDLLEKALSDSEYSITLDIPLYGGTDEHDSLRRGIDPGDALKRYMWLHRDELKSN